MHSPHPSIERAHRVGQVNPSWSSAPRLIVMKFLNYKDREKTLRATRKQKEVRYENQRVNFFPDLSAETRQRQRQFNGVKARPGSKLGQVGPGPPNHKLGPPRRFAY